MVTLNEELATDFTPKLQAGIFNGVGPTPEVDAYKDLMARLTLIPFSSESPVQIDLGASVYYGGIAQTGDSVITTTSGKTQNVFNTETGSMVGFGNRENVGVESQGNFLLDVLPLEAQSSKASGSGASAPHLPVSAVARDTVKFVQAVAAKNLQIRNQSGYYVMLVQNFGKTAQLVAKYDFFDRNTDATGTQVTNSADAAFWCNRARKL